MAALPNGAAETAGIAFDPPVFTKGFEGRKGASSAVQQIGPIPGPPPPCCHRIYEWFHRFR